MKFFRNLAVAVMLLFAVNGYYLGYQAYLASQKDNVNTGYVKTKISSVKELSRSELTYHGMKRYTDGKIPILTKRSFVMYYTANAQAAVDLSQAECHVTDDTVLVKLPQATVTNVSVDPSSISFEDQWNTVMKVENYKVRNTQTAAFKDFYQNADKDQLISQANQQASDLVTGVLKGNIGKRELKIIQG